MFGNSACVGCSACANICPQNCITMQSDEEGFCYPVADPGRCIACGRCVTVCPVQKEPLTATCAIQAYGAVSKKESQRMASSSGGIFSLLAENILDRGGVVFGAAFSDDFKSVNHMAVENREELVKLRGSKYLQSRIGNAYVQAKQYLDQGRAVLFTGTPCQIGGLRAFLGRDYDQLHTQSVVCHGVPSPKVWENYVVFQEQKAGALLSGISFRVKKPDWQNYSLEFAFGYQKSYSCRASEDMFMRCFLKDLMLRPSCYACQFKGIQDPSDLSLADFWGIQHVLPELNDGKGTSLVLVRTEKGRKLLESIAADMKLRPVDYTQAVAGNAAAVYSVKKPQLRSRFMKDIQNKPVHEVLIRYSRDTVVRKTASRLRWYRVKLQRICLKYWKK